MGQAVKSQGGQAQANRAPARTWLKPMISLAIWGETWRAQYSFFRNILNPSTKALIGQIKAVIGTSEEVACPMPA